MTETVIGIFAGLVITAVISGYYYRLGARHRLAIYVLQQFQVLSDLDPEIRRNFTVEFNETPVKNLAVLELIVVNEGTHPIRDCVDPLAVQLPDGVSLLDATVPYINPEGRNVSAAINSKKHFEYRFSILNPREYFLTKIVTDGYVDLDKLSITIAADNLPPRIKPEFNERVETEKHRALGVGVSLGALGVYVFFGLYVVSMLSLVNQVDKNLLPTWLHLPSPYPLSMVGVTTIILVIVDAVACAVFFLAILFGGSFPPPRRFPLPERLRAENRPIRLSLGMEMWREKRDNPDEPNR